LRARNDHGGEGKRLKKAPYLKKNGEEDLGGKILPGKRAIKRGDRKILGRLAL